MLYVTGDTHGDIDFFKLHYFAGENPNLTYKDYVIICGDFGGIWSKHTLFSDLKRYRELNFTVLFVDGNHENFDLLNAYPVENWHGGKVHKIAPNIIHLIRGQVFTIERCKLFTFGGGTSIDRAFRIEGRSWWRQELPSMEEVDEGLSNLSKNNFEVDYIITHSCDERALYYKPLNKISKSLHVYPDNSMLNTFEEQVKYKHWYFGHYHADGNLTDKKTVLYQQIRELKTNKVVFGD